MTFHLRSLHFGFETGEEKFVNFLSWEMNTRSVGWSVYKAKLPPFPHLNCISNHHFVARRLSLCGEAESAFRRLCTPHARGCLIEGLIWPTRRATNSLGWLEADWQMIRRLRDARSSLSISLSNICDGIPSSAAAFLSFIYGSRTANDRPTLARGPTDMTSEGINQKKKFERLLTTWKFSDSAGWKEYDDFRIKMSTSGIKITSVKFTRVTQETETCDS